MKNTDFDKFSHISTKMIKNDINDTEKEIIQLENERKVLSQNRLANRLEVYLRDGKIEKRKDFIYKLKDILEYRRN